MPSVIVVDDDPYMRKLIKSVLQEAGHKVHVTSNGVECLDYLVEFEPNLIITDICMPHMDGIQAIKNILSITRTIKIIAITSDNQTFKDSYSDAALKLGVSSVLLKPFKITDLLKAVNQALNTVSDNNISK